jgi:hypothetical protein
VSATTTTVCVPEAHATVSLSTVHPGDSTTVSGSCLKPSSPIEISLGSLVLSSGAATDANGAYNVLVVIPSEGTLAGAGIALGSNDIVVTGTDPSGATHNIHIPITIVA